MTQEFQKKSSVAHEHGECVKTWTDGMYLLTFEILQQAPLMEKLVLRIPSDLCRQINLDISVAFSKNIHFFGIENDFFLNYIY